MNMKRYATRVLIALDQLLNTILNGAPDETVSSRCARNRHAWYWRGLAAFLEWLDPGHLDRSLQSEIDRDHFPPELRADDQRSQADPAGQI